ncbi:hypothetical protein NL108_013597 [Boleophthalmus pectinirostris]|nr:hypothetical protein NL108_013597 [Boleophthalmus pectinirostris]
MLLTVGLWVYSVVHMLKVQFKVKGCILLHFLSCYNVVSSSQTNLELCFVSFTHVKHTKFFSQTENTLDLVMSCGNTGSVSGSVYMRTLEGKNDKIFYQK